MPPAMSFIWKALICFDVFGPPQNIFSEFSCRLPVYPTLDCGHWHVTYQYEQIVSHIFEYLLIICLFYWLFIQKDSMNAQNWLRVKMRGDHWGYLLEEGLNGNICKVAIKSLLKVQAYVALISWLTFFAMLVTQIKTSTGESLSQGLILIGFAEVKVKAEPRPCRMPLVTKCCYTITNPVWQYWA